MPFDIIAILKTALEVTMWLVLPPLLISMVIGLLVSIFQAVTQLQDQSLQFVPKLILVCVVLFYMFQFNLDKMTDLTKTNFEVISNIKTNSYIKTPANE